MAGFGQVRIASTLSGSTFKLLASTICPKYLTIVYPKKCFLHFANNFSIHNFSNTACKIYTCYSTVGLRTSISSNYIVMQQVRSENIKFISRWKVAGALHKPIGMTIYSYKPYGVRKAVLGLSPSRLQTWWYAWLRSMELNMVALPNWSNRSATRGMGNTSSLIWQLRLQ